MSKLSPEFLKALAYIYSDTNRWDLENAGIIPTGAGGDTQWKRFNHDFDIFILKIGDERRSLLASYFNARLSASRTATTSVEVE